MNQKFFCLAEDKQTRILNSAMKVFSENSYKGAITDDIAMEANISKGLLFHYFGSKKELYLYTYQYAIDFIRQQMASLAGVEERDFFEIIRKAQLAKMKTMLMYPFIYDFILRAYYEKDSKVSTDIANLNQSVTSTNFSNVLERYDRHLFKDSVDPARVLDLILWSAEGFMRFRLQAGQRDLKALNEEYLQILTLMRQHFYKEEYV